ncbi:hypothetical protein D3C73_1596900 [compost metagenome]
MKDVDLDTLIRALYIGYEVEQTVEEQLKETYDQVMNKVSSENHPETNEFWNGQAAGIENALNIIGMKVKGINA